MQLRVKLIAALIGAGMTLSGATQAQAAPSPSPMSDSDKKFVMSQLDAQLNATQGKGGVVINERQISYDNGNVIFTAALPATGAAKVAHPDSASGSRYDCPTGWLCLWSGGNFSNTRWQFRDEGIFQQLSYYNATPFNSFYNNRNHRYFLHLNDNFAPERCYSAQTAVSRIDSTYKYAAVIYLATSNNAC